MDAPGDLWNLPRHVKTRWLLFLLASCSLQPAAATVAAASATLLRREGGGRVGARNSGGVEVSEDTEGSAEKTLEILKLGTNALLGADETHNNGGAVNMNAIQGHRKTEETIIPESLAEGAETSAEQIVDVTQNKASGSRDEVLARPQVFSQIRMDDDGEQRIHGETVAQQESKDSFRGTDVTALVAVRGPPGGRGSMGEPGENGEEGAHGESGPRGELVAGLPGERGEQGELGVKGMRGERGPAGPPGPPGDKWDSTEEARQMIAFGNELYARYMELTEFEDKVSAQLLSETNQIADETGADDAALKAHGNDIILLQQVGEEAKHKLEHAKERETFIMKEMPRKLDRIKRVHEWLDRATVKVEHEQNTTLPSDNATLTPDAPPEEKGDTSASGYLKELAGTTFDWTHLKLQHLVQDFYKDVAHSNDDDGAEVQKQNEQAPPKSKEGKEAKPHKR